MSDILDSIDELPDDFEFDEDEIVSGDVVDGSDEVAVVEDEEMNEGEAQEITEAIRSTAAAIYVLLIKAHEGKAYKALGYTTWADYVNTEFEMSASRSYQLINFGKAISEIEAVTPEGTQVKLTEAQVRDIKRELPKITQQIEEATRDKTPEEASAEVDRVVDEIREQKKNEDKEAAKKQDKADAEAQEEYQKNLEEAANAILEADGADTFTDSADDGLVDVPVEGSGEEGMSSEDSVYLYNFFNVLATIKELPEPDDFITIIPKSRANELEEGLLAATEWFNRMHTLWEAEQDNM